MSRLRVPPVFYVAEPARILKKSAQQVGAKAPADCPLKGQRLVFAGSYFQSKEKEFVGKVKKLRADGHYEVTFYDGTWYLPKKDIDALARKQLNKKSRTTKRKQPTPSDQVAKRKRATKKKATNTKVSTKKRANKPTKAPKSKKKHKRKAAVTAAAAADSVEQAPFAQASAPLRRSNSICYDVALLKSAGFSGEVMKDAGGVPFDCELTQIRPAENVDKYYNFQLIRQADGAVVLHAEWGRTGARPQTKTDGPFTPNAVGVAAFENLFRAKTGNEWQARTGFSVRPGKYDYVQRTTAVRTEYSWQFYMDASNQHGESEGWKPYRADGNTTVNQLYAQWVDNKRMPLRFVQSGYFSYSVDFDKMVQANSQTKFERPIRRIAKSSESAPALMS